jgi:hypothetical protein
VLQLWNNFQAMPKKSDKSGASSARAAELLLSSGGSAFGFGETQIFKSEVMVRVCVISLPAASLRREHSHLISSSPLSMRRLLANLVHAPGGERL